MSKNKLKRNIPPALLRSKSPKLKLPLPPKVEVKKPKVSVILSSYNHAEYVAAAIESVLNQTFTDFELLIYDDGSSDNSREIIKSFDDPRIKTFLYEENRGPHIAFRESADAARGKYFAVQHSDDLWRSDKLQKQVDFLEAHEEYAACFTWVDFIDENGNLQVLDDNDFYKGRFDQPNRSRAEWLNYFFYNSNCLCHPSIMFRHEAYKKYNLYDVKGLWQLPDYATWIKLCFHSNIYILDERLILFRLRRRKQENISAFTSETVLRAMTEIFCVMYDFIEYFKDDKFFLEVFPETKPYVINGEFNRKFAFAKLCLKKVKKDYEVFQLIGLSILRNLLAETASAKQIKKLYDYDEKSFFNDTGHYDVFNLKQKMSMIEGRIYLDTGNDFNADEVIYKAIFVDSNGNFYAKYIFNSDKPIKKLRFDPGEDFISLHVESIKVNGVIQNEFTASLSKYDGKFYDFLTCDPQVIFTADNLTGQIIFEISAEIERNYKLRLNTYFSESEQQISTLNSEILRLNQWRKDLERTNSELNSLNVELNSRNEDLNTQINNRNLQIEDLNTQITSLDTQITGLDTQITNLNTQITNLDTQITNLNTKTANLNTQIEKLNNQNKVANEHIDNLTAENIRLNGVLNGVLNSNSWKITKPLRKIGTFLKEI